MFKKSLRTLRNTLLFLLNRGAFHVILGSYLTKFVSLFGSIFLVRILSKNEYGVLVYYENFIGYFVILMGFGSAYGVLRFMVLPDSFEEKKGIFKYAFNYGSLANLFLIFVSLLFLLKYPHPKVFLGYTSVIHLLVFSLPFSFIMQLGLMSLRALFDNKRYATLSFFSTFTIVFFRVIGAVYGGVTSTVTLRLIAEVLCSFICLIAVHSIYFRQTHCQPTDKKTRKKFRSYSLQIMITNGLWTVFMLNDVFMLGQLSGSESIVADYKVAYVIPANLSVLVAAIGIFVAPYFTKHDSQGNHKWVQAKTPLVLKWTSFILAPIVAICAICAKPIINLIYGEAYLTATPIMRLLLLASYINNGVRAPLANILSAIGKQKVNLLVAGGGVILQIILNIFLIPRRGAIGVAVASTIVYAIMSTILGVFFFKKFRSNAS